jgi:hypothetical protein
MTLHRRLGVTLLFLVGCSGAPPAKQPYSVTPPTKATTDGGVPPRAQAPDSGASDPGGAHDAGTAAPDQGMALVGVGTACEVNGVFGTCLETSHCAAPAMATPGHCPGPANVQCCTGLPAQPPPPVGPCIPQLSTIDDGYHNPGTSCAASTCHDGLLPWPKWTVSGTLYDTHGKELSGATVELTDAKGVTLNLVSAMNGNFYTDHPLTYPVRVSASLCPTTAPMVTLVDGPADCNSCHTGAMRIHP